MDNTVNSSGTFTQDSTAGNKFEISHLNLHYGDFHALKDINMNIKKNLLFYKNLVFCCVPFLFVLYFLCK